MASAGPGQARTATVLPASVIAIRLTAAAVISPVTPTAQPASTMRRRPPWILSSRPKMLRRFSLLSASPRLLRQYLLYAITTL